MIMNGKIDLSTSYNDMLQSLLKANYGEMGKETKSLIIVF